MPQDPSNLIWIDLEMTGLDPAQDYIIEVATIITDANLSILDEGPVIAVHQPESVLEAMDEWNTRHHGDSGLTQRVRDSDIRDRDAERMTLAFVKEYVPPGVSPMCGNSICQDRRFLARLMPELEQYFHYRNLDVSTLKELAARWKPELLDRVQKKSAHRALEDIHESILELKFYRQEMFSI